MDRTTYDQPVSSGEESDALIQSPVWGGDSESSEKQTPLTLYTVFLTLFAAIGGFLFGYDTGVISGAMILIKDTFSLSSFWQELVVSVTIGTSIIGALLGGYLNHQFGRRPVLILSAAVFTAGAVTMGVAHSREILLLGRLIVGFGIGAASMTVPVYVAEAAPAHLRGQLVTLNNVFITGGQFVAAVVDGLLSETREGWRYMLGLGAVPSIIMFFGCLMLPESPRWLVSQGYSHKARNVLVKVRGTQDVDEELQSIQDTCEEEAQLQEEHGGGVLLKTLGLGRTRKALIVGCALQAVQQLAGINTVMYYGATIILMSGVGSNKVVIWLAALVAFLNFLFTWLGLYLVERVGRRKLLLVSLAGVVISLFLLGGAFYIFERYDPMVDFREASAPENLLAKCPNTGNCMDCVKLDTCGFCYSKDKLNDPVNGSCVFINSSAHNAAAFGRCTTEHEGLWWSQGACPSKFAWFAVVGLALYIAAFAPGMGPMPWTLNSEIYPLWARTTGTSCATAVNWSFNLLISMTFLSLMEWITRAGAFWLYGTIAFVGWVFFYYNVPETRGKSLEELQNLFV